MRFAAAFIIMALIAALGGCAAQDVMPVVSPAGQAHATPAAGTPRPSPVPSPSPAPTPPPTPCPTPTPDPEDAYFLDGDGETVFINDDRTRFEYRTRTLSIEIDERYDAELKLRYYVAHIRTRGDERIRMGYGDGLAPGTKRNKPYIIARKYGAVLAQNADFFIEPDNPKGVVMRGGKVYADGKGQDTLAVMPDGALAVYRRGEITAAALIEMGVEDALSFGPILVEGGEEAVGKSRVGGHNPRSGIGMVKNGHYVSIVVDGHSPGMANGATLAQFARMFVEEGCVLAYNMDGGQSSSMVFMGDSCNTHAINVERNIHGQRKVPDIIWFGASASVPGEKDPVINNGQGNKKDTEGLEGKQYTVP